MTGLDLNQFSQLIHHKGGKTEVECQKYAPLFAHFLVPSPADIFEQVLFEEPSRAGRTDFTVVYSDGVTGRRSAILWEAKAPQSYVFQRDAGLIRLRPTDELVKAETQLVYYVDELRNSNSFKQKYGLSDRDEVKAGGIIIGKSQELIASDSADVNREAQHALWLRMVYLYKQAGIKIHHWDTIHRFLIR